MATLKPLYLNDDNCLVLNAGRYRACVDLSSLIQETALNLNSPITGYTVGANSILADTDTILQAFGKVQGQLNAKLSTAGDAYLGNNQTWTGVNTFNPSVNTSSGISRGLYITGNHSATANSDKMYGLVISPTFVNASFTSVNNYGALIIGNFPFTSNVLQLQNTNTGGYSRLEFLANNGVSGGSIGYGNVTGNFHINADYSSNMVFQGNGAERMRITANGNVLIKSTVDSGEALQVTGNVNIKTPSGRFLFSDYALNYNASLVFSANGYLALQAAGGSPITLRVSGVGNIIWIDGSSYGTTIGVEATTAHASSILDVRSITKGALLPRMTTAQFAAIASKAQGLEAYSTDDAAKLWWDGTRVVGFRYNGTKFQGYEGTTWSDLN